jgi:hypothetical protein
MPAVLRRRREVQARRRISLATLDSIVGPDGGVAEPRSGR